MANQKKIAVIVLAVILGIVGVVYFAKNTSSSENGSLTQNTAVETERFGIVNMDEVLAAHPYYEQLEKLKKERNELMLGMEKTRQISLDETAPSVDFSAVDNLMNQKRNEKLKAKFQELNNRLQEQEIALRKKHQVEYDAIMQEIDGQYVNRIFNLQLKLKTLQISQETAVDIQSQIEALKAEQAKQMQEKQSVFFAQISGPLQEAQAKAKQEMDEYVAVVDKELMEEAHKQVEDQQTRNHLAMAGKSNALQLSLDGVGDKQSDLENKEKEIAVLEEKLIGEIVLKVEEIAKKNRLSVVFARVQVNVNAQDITELVVKAFKN